MSSPAIPVEERFGGLRESLFALAIELTKALKKNPPLHNAAPEDVFWSLTLPWIAEFDTPDPVPDLRRAIEGRKQEVTATGFDGEAAARRLQEILSKDTHLAECCPTLGLLARHLSRHFLHDASTIMDVLSEPVGVDSLYESFANLTYGQGRFRRSAFTHVFNLDIEGKDVQIADVRILRLNPDLQRSLLGEKTYSPFLHPPNVGNCFIFENEGVGLENDLKWLFAKRSAALNFIGLMQYSRPGLVCAGYTVPAFFPQWAHEIRRDGLFFIGDPKRDAYRGGTEPYVLGSEDVKLLTRLRLGLTKGVIKKKLDDRSSKLRQAILRAGEYYERSHQVLDYPQRLIFLAVALEALFSPENREQLRFRISQNAAQLLGKDPASKSSIFRSAQELYERRNKIVHGAYDVDKHLKGTLVSAEEIREWSDLIRRSIVAFFVLALRGEVDRSGILRRLEEAAFDDGAANQIQELADVTRFMDEQGL